MEKFVILFFIVLFIFIGFIIYKRVLFKQDDNQTNDYYNIDFLWSNGYIKDADVISDSLDDVLMYLDGENVFHIKSSKESVVIEGLPKGDLKVYYTEVSDGCYEFATLDGNDLYYVNMCLGKKKDFSFELISTNAKGIFVSLEYDGVFLFEKNGFVTNFIISTLDDKIRYIESKDGIFGLYNEIKDIKPYFNYLCISDSCNDSKSYITFKNEIVLYNQSDVLKKANGEVLVAQDVFAVSSDEFLYTIYILDKDNRLYSVDVRDSNQSLFAVCVKDEKVKTINKMDDYVVITYMNGDYKKIVDDGGIILPVILL